MIKVCSVSPVKDRRNKRLSVLYPIKRRIVLKTLKNLLQIPVLIRLNCPIPFAIKARGIVLFRLSRWIDFEIRISYKWSIPTHSKRMITDKTKANQVLIRTEPNRAGGENLTMDHLHDIYQVNQDPNKIISKIRSFALDMDGTVYLDETWIDGAKEFLARIEQTGRSYCFMTNNSSKNAEVYVDKLHRMGLDIDPERQLITSGHATIAYLKKHCPGKRVYLFGNRVLMDEFEAGGIRLEEEHPDVVVTAFDTSFDYGKLCKLCDFVRTGIPFIGTHPDYNCPTKTGFIPDIGSLHAYIQASTGRMPDKIVGKPNREMIEYTLDIMGAEAGTTAVVGDRLYTDVKSGVANGLYGIFVLSGEAQLTDLASSDIKPHAIFDSVKNIIPLL